MPHCRCQEHQPLNVISGPFKPDRASCKPSTGTCERGCYVLRISEHERIAAWKIRGTYARETASPLFSCICVSTFCLPSLSGTQLPKLIRSLEPVWHFVYQQEPYGRHHQK
jgi:hypothetical protein